MPKGPRMYSEIFKEMEDGEYIDVVTNKPVFSKFDR